MKQYPHFLFIKNSAEATQDLNGNWIAETESWAFHSICREQTNGKGNLVNGQDGKAIIFTSLIHLPLASGLISEGSEVLVSNTKNVSGSRIQKQVLKYDVGQLHDRLWL